MIGTLFKGVFAIFIVLAGIITIVTMLATYNLDGSLGSAPVWVIVFAGVALFWNKFRTKPEAALKSDSDPKAPLRLGKNVFEGHGANIELRDDSISITRHGTASLLIQGLKGEKRIPFASITAIQFKEATRRMSGYVQFSILGGVESRKGIWDATLDENTVMFTHDQMSRFYDLRDLVEAKLSDSRRPQAALQHSVADELTKLADLRTKGILTDEEFAMQKASILSR